MRLIDQVVNSAPDVGVRDQNGRNHRLPGVGSKADAIRSCDLRYILDEAASRECMNLVLFPNGDLLDPANALLRLPAPNFWVEWVGMQTFGEHPRVGALVEASDDGLQGSITGYWQDALGRAATMGSSIGFDLTPHPRAQSRIHNRPALRHATCLHLNDLLQRSHLVLDPAWDAHFRARPFHPYRESLRAIANGSWFYLPFVLAFSAMLNSKDVITERASQLDRLNAARLRRGREPLLDHIEVGMQLGRSHAHGSNPAPALSRCRPRLHHVRGHFVHRAGKTFWRMSHLRGDAERPIRSKTILVSAEQRTAALHH